jgi:hypothetical protein
MFMAALYQELDHAKNLDKTSNRRDHAFSVVNRRS